MKKLVLIDGSSLIHRAYYALPPLSTSKGQVTNAVYGFALMLWRLLDDLRPDHLAVAFDLKGPTFRHERYERYKANRTAPPDDLVPQFDLLKDFLKALNIPILQQQGVEADDIIGTLSRTAKEEGFETVIVTGDRDCLQLVDDSTVVYLTRKGISNIERFDEKAVREAYGGLGPEKLTDLKGLMGDSSDNIPGVPGIGEKTAVKLLAQWGSLEAVLENASRAGGKKLSENLMKYGEQALMSRELATIKRDVELGVGPSACRWSPPERARVVEVLKELEFTGLMDRLDSLGLDKEVEPSAGARAERTPYVTLSLSELDRAEEDLKDSRFIVVSPEIEDRTLFGIALARPEEDAPVFYIPQAAEDPSRLKGLLQRRIIGHDVKPLISLLLYQSTGVPGEVAFDTALAAYLLESTRSGYPLEHLTRSYLLLEIPSREDLQGKGRQKAAWANLDSGVRGEYSASRVDAIRRLMGPMTADLERDGLLNLYREIELPLLPVLARMEARGMYADKEALAEMSAELGAEIDRLERRIHDLCGVEFNINSPKQLGEILFDKLGLPAGKKTKTGYSTSAEVLEQLAPDYEVVRLVLRYRHLIKLKGTYADGLAALIDPADGRIHTSFNQTITATGRISSTEPNLQNIPVRDEVGRQIRRVFVTGSDDLLLVGADYSQIELRVLAHLSGDETLTEAFRSGEDIHRLTASEIFGLDPGDVDSAARNRAKAVNFGIVYGISDFGLARDTGVTRKEAAEFIARYFERYRGVKEFMERSVEEARRRGYVTTLFGRRRYIPDINNRNRMVRSFAERTAMNTPIQGTAADIIKVAMINVDRRLRKEGLEAHLLLQVHDELILEARREIVSRVREILKEEMEGAVSLSVPLVAEVHDGRSWYDLK